MAYRMDEFLFSHAGVSAKFMDSVFGKEGWTVDTLVDQLNELFKYKPNTFTFGNAISINKLSYTDPYGDNEEQSPIWIRVRSLVSANKNTELKKAVRQIFGHTQVTKIDLALSMKALGGKYYPIDALSTSREYLVIEDGELIVKSFG
jgi:hypothetical protein